MAEVVKTGLLDLEKELSCSVSPLGEDLHGDVKLCTYAQYGQLLVSSVLLMSPM